MRVCCVQCLRPLCHLWLPQSKLTSGQPLIMLVCDEGSSESRSFGVLVLALLSLPDSAFALSDAYLCTFTLERDVSIPGFLCIPLAVSTRHNIQGVNVRLSRRPAGMNSVLCSLEYNPQAGPTKFMIGTEQGNIMTCNRKAKNPQDRVGASFPGIKLLLHMVCLMAIGLCQSPLLASLAVVPAVAFKLASPLCPFAKLPICQAVN